jgi:translation initiation factor IF-3
MVGIVPVEEARRLAREAELDLVEVSPNADPPVCKILDYGKFKYEQKKREHEARRKKHGGDLKEVRFRPGTDTHDREIKLNRARHFLEEGHRVQITLMFRGREMQHISRGGQILQGIVDELGDHAKLERPTSREGRRMHLVLMPSPELKRKDKSRSGRKAEVERRETDGADPGARTAAPGDGPGASGSADAPPPA